MKKINENQENRLLDLISNYGHKMILDYVYNDFVDKQKRLIEHLE